MATYIKTMKTGRPVQPGRWVYDPNQRAFGVFVGYCECGCHAKIIKQRDDLDVIFKYCRKDQRSLATRMWRLVKRSRTI
jgi:hypothetical protein